MKSINGRVCQGLLVSLSLFGCAGDKSASETESAPSEKFFSNCNLDWKDQPKAGTDKPLAAVPVGYEGNFVITPYGPEKISKNKSHAAKTLVLSYQGHSRDIPDEVRAQLGLNEVNNVYLKASVITGVWKSDSGKQSASLNPADGTMELTFTHSDGILGLGSDFKFPGGRTGGIANGYATCTSSSSGKTSLATCKKLGVNPLDTPFAKVYKDNNMSSSFNTGLGSSAEIQNFGPIGSGSDKERFKVKIVSESSITKESGGDDFVYIYSKDLNCKD